MLWYRHHMPRNTSYTPCNTLHIACRRTHAPPHIPHSITCTPRLAASHCPLCATCHSTTPHRTQHTQHTAAHLHVCNMASAAHNLPYVHLHPSVPFFHTTPFLPLAPACSFTLLPICFPTRPVVIAPTHSRWSYSLHPCPPTSLPSVVPTPLMKNPFLLAPPILA